MSELGPGYNPEEEQNQGLLSDDERQLILDIAETKKLGFALRVESKKITLPDPTLAVKAKYENDNRMLQAEATGEMALNHEEAIAFMSENVQKVEAEANLMKAIAPEYASFLLANIAKNKQAAGENPDDKIKEANELIALGNREAQVPSDLMNRAILTGILTRKNAGQNIAALEKIAASGINDEQLLRACALALSDEKKSELLTLLPDEQRTYALALLDNESAKLLRHDVIEEPEKEVAGQITARVETEFNRLLGEHQYDRQLVSLLSQTLCQLGSGEALGILKTVAKEGIAGSTERNNERIVARVIHELIKEDDLAGSRLAMNFIGSERVNDHYFSYFLNYLAENDLIQKTFDQVDHWGEEKCQKLFATLKEKMPEFADLAISGPFENGVKVFGLRRMLKYAGRPDVGVHDSVFAFDKAVRLFENSGMSENEFYGRILNQIYLDGSTYQSGNSYQEFNEIAGSIDISPSHLRSMKEKAEKYQNIDRLHGLVELLSEPKNIFSSWNNLRKFSELSHLLERASILEQLSALKTESESDERKAMLYRYIETIAFHDDSRVDMQEVLKFWRNPESFLETGDEHTQAEIQNAKKPSNYIEIPHLDLTAAELRDSLVCGELDRIQAFKPMEIVYSVEQAAIEQELSFFQTVQRGLGSRKEGTANTKLFNELRKIFSAYKISVNEFIETNGEVLNNLPAVDVEQLKKQVIEAIAQLPNEKIDRQEKKAARRFRARVNRKSDPQAVLAGNDTACCMPFGSGKNNIYTFNPNCAMFTLEEAKGPDRWRTIAQSVLTLDKDIKRPIPEIIEELKVNRYNLSDVLPEEAVIERDCYLAADNIEVAGNAVGSHKVIEAIYRDFFEKYLASVGQSESGPQISQDKIVIGQGYSDLRYGDREDNTYAPLAPVAYSDKVGPQVDVIRFAAKKGSDIVVKAETETEGIENALPVERRASGLTPLTYRDTLAVSYIEGKAYKSNESLLAYLHNMENGLIAKDINNENKSRPNLSLKYVDSSGRVRGYIFAYEGESDQGDPMIYISDLASDMESQMAGGRLINGFVENYKREYVDKGDLKPIYVEAREKTSYPIIISSVNKIAERLGVRIRVDEVGTRQVGDDIMHELWLRPVAT